MTKHKSIAVDGPSGAGKSTLAKLLARRLGFLYVDTGAIYRTVGLRAYRAGVDPEDEAAVTALLDGLDIELKYGADGLQHMYLDGEDVTDAIRQHVISRYTSGVSAIPAVRAFLLERQRDMAREHDVIMDGRDIGTVVLPGADVKIFLTASPEDRARRRFDELRKRGQEADYDTVLRDIILRDEHDTRRSAAPLRQAKDALLVDTTGNSLDESLDVLLETIKERLKNVIYCIAYMVLWVVFRIVMPTRCINKQNRPEGGALLCANHTRTNDPLFIAYALGWHYQIHVMAKEEIMHWPFIGWVLKHGGIFGVKRGKADVAAIKTAMKYLKDGELLLMFPEGTRHQDGEFGDAKTGAAMLALRTGVPIVPIYLPAEKKWFRWNPVVFGEAYYPKAPEGRKPTPEDYHAVADDLMERIEALKPQAGR